MTEKRKSERRSAQNRRSARGSEPNNGDHARGLVGGKQITREPAVQGRCGRHRNRGCGEPVLNPTDTAAFNVAGNRRLVVVMRDGDCECQREGTGTQHQLEDVRSPISASHCDSVYQRDGLKLTVSD